MSDHSKLRCSVQAHSACTFLVLPQREGCEDANLPRKSAQLYPAYVYGFGKCTRRVFLLDLSILGLSKRTASDGCATPIEVLRWRGKMRRIRAALCLEVW